MRNRKAPPRLRLKREVRLHRFIRQNITPRATMDVLDGDGVSIAIATDEGHVLFRSDAMSSLGMLNKCWDGTPLLTLDRADFDHLLVMNPRVTVSIMTQMGPFQKFLETRGVLGRSAGHFARYLVGHPISTQGYRGIWPVELVWEHLTTFNARTRALLARYVAMINSGPATREVVEFSPDAKARWFALASETEWLLRPGQYLSDINDFASKTMEIVGRVAALFHYYSGETGQITLDTLERAFTIVKWHVEEYKRLFGPQSAVRQDLVDAQAVGIFLRTHVWRGTGSVSFVAKNWLLQHGPVRQRDRLNAALHILVSYQAVTIGVATKGKQKFVNLLDPYFASMQ